MAAGRHLGSSVRNLFTLHNLFIPWRWTSTVVKVVSPIPVDVLDEFAVRLVQEKTQKWRSKMAGDTERNTEIISKANNRLAQEHIKIENAFVKKQAMTLQTMKSNTNIETNILDLLSRNKHQEVENLLQMLDYMSENTLLKLFIAYSDSANIDKIINLQECAKTWNKEAYLQNGKFNHFLCKAQCLHGNSEKGLAILTNAYGENNMLRNVYRTLFRDLIHDSVANRSVASLVIFKRYVIMWSELYCEQLPLVCLWHSCWTSCWFSDQQLAEELVDTHSVLRSIIQDRICALMMTALVRSGDGDAVARLLQMLLKHQLLETYEQALQILFNFRLKNEDVRGCTEILRNAEFLGLQLSQSLQSKYIHMVINKGHKLQEKTVPKPDSDNILFKF